MKEKVSPMAKELLPLAKLNFLKYKKKANSQQTQLEYARFTRRLASKPFTALFSAGVFHIPVAI
ncbi:hypothetical protein [Alteribacillus bidgolensis]|uniref:hypothetical protein n=1 Tax=Alteribacillus bidgolensis TaxID=930129 RepID=UPI0011137F40|nr:hypothetical protein [Alteribacillus bidgolensis]